MSLQARLNVVYGRLAEEQRLTMEKPNIEDTTIPQTKVTLFFNNIQITNNLQRYIREQLYDTEMKEYIKLKYKWTEKNIQHNKLDSTQDSYKKRHIALTRIATIKEVHGW